MTRSFVITLLAAVCVIGLSVSAPSDGDLLKEYSKYECGGLITTPNVTISSSSAGSSGYRNLADCRWFIVAPPVSLVQLRFISFDLEASSECQFDSVEIFDNIITNASNARPIGKYCGRIAPPIILSTSQALTIHLKSDESFTGDGFVATYDFIEGRNISGI